MATVLFAIIYAAYNEDQVDKEGRFVGIYDFNLAGRDEILNYLFREIFNGAFLLP